LLYGKHLIEEWKLRHEGNGWYASHDLVADLCLTGSKAMLPFTHAVTVEGRGLDVAIRDLGRLEAQVLCWRRMMERAQSVLAGVEWKDYSTPGTCEMTAGLARAVQRMWSWRT